MSIYEMLAIDSEQTLNAIEVEKINDSDYPEAAKQVEELIQTLPDYSMQDEFRTKVLTVETMAQKAAYSVGFKDAVRLITACLSGQAVKA